jgi:Ca2+-binding RTX toxin-like protein
MGDDTLDGGAGVDMASFFVHCNPFVCDHYGPVSVDLGAGTASGQGADTLIGIEKLRGSAFEDTLIGDAGPNRMYGLEGNDSLFGLAGDDHLNGGDDSDTGDGGPQVVADICFSIETPTDCESIF